MARFMAPRFFVSAALIAFLLGTASSAQAQFGGVKVDAQGVFELYSVDDSTGQLQKKRIRQAKASLDHDLARASKMRKISLNRLEAALGEKLIKNGHPTEAMRYLAGLTRVQYVFYYPKTKDIVIAGPAEGWVEDPSGRVVGIHSGRPTIQLQDLIVALRSFAPDADPTNQISVSIDPTQEGLAALQEYRRNNRPRKPSDAKWMVEGMRKSLGNQVVSIGGVSNKTHFAQVLVEADYRMKMIGIGLEKPSVKIKSFIAAARPGKTSRNALMRWYFVPDYDCVRMSEDGLAMEMVGQGVKLVGVNEAVGQGGGRSSAQTVDRASQVFCNSFTKNYSKLAAKTPVYAQLRNLIDLSVAAAHIQSQGMYDEAGWDLGVFRNEEQYPVETYRTPVQVENQINAVFKGSTLMTPIGGGVDIRATLALDENNLRKDKLDRPVKARKEIDTAKVDAKKWWWD